MAELLPKVRRYSDAHFKVTLSDNGVPVSWDSVTIQRLFMYSEKQKSFGGKASFQVGADPHELLVTWHAYSQQFLGAHRVVIQIELAGGVATYDAQACNVVASTSMDSDIETEDIEVPIEVTEVDTTIMHEILVACQTATVEATAAAQKAEDSVETLRGGLQGQVLRKKSDEPLDFEWKTAEETEIVQEEGDRTDVAMSQAAVTRSLANKVDKVTGKGLSTNDYTTAEKNKLAGLENYDDAAIKGRVSAIEGKEAGWDAKYSKPNTGIPATDLASGVQTTLGKVTELESNVGNLPSLTTTEKSNLVGAVNEVNAKKANTDGYYEGMTVGNAGNLAGNVVEDAMFTRRTSGGYASIKRGAATIKALKGNTIVWNQLGTGQWAAMAWESYEFNNNGGGTFVCQDVNYQRFSFGNNVTFGVKDHKYLFIADMQITSNSTGAPRFGWGFTSNNNSVGGSDYSVSRPDVKFNERFRFSVFKTCNGVDRNAMFAVSNSGGWLQGASTTFNIYTAMIFDLTQMFGAGNEPSTVEEFEALFPLDYYAYNAGELLSFNGTGIKTDGFNQFNKNTIVSGYIDNSNGRLISHATRFSSDYIRVFPNTDYFIRSEQIAAKWGAWYDADKNFIGGITSINYNNVLTSPANAAYVRVTCIGEQGGSADTFCINLSHSGIRNGEYEPYWTETKQLPSLDFFNVTYTGADGQQHVAGGMKSAGTAKDEWNGTKKVRRIGVVDLGSLSWNGAESSGIWRWTSSGDFGKAFGFTNLLCARYTTNAGASARSGDKLISGYRDNGNVYITDNAYTTAASFKAAMAGVLLYYELATPVEADAEPLGIYREDDWGTETLLPENDDEPTTSPIIADIMYGIDAVGTIRNLPKDYISKVSMDSVLSAMVSAGIIGGYTLTYNGRSYDCTITPTE